MIDLIMILCFGLTCVCVRLISGETKAGIYFNDGNIIDARCDETIGLDALHKALSLKEGKYQVELYVSSLEQTIGASWKDILKDWSAC